MIEISSHRIRGRYASSCMIFVSSAVVMSPCASSTCSRSVVRQAYEIQSWHQAGRTPYRTRPPEDVKVDDRWEFLGAVANSLASKYCGGSVESYLHRHAQFSVTYVNC
jgi:hypothetical protein